jgi:CRISPR-associated exonuclease Cas4
MDAGEPIPLSALQHAVYCLRQAAKLHRADEVQLCAQGLCLEPPTVHKSRCRACSLHEVCRPEACARPARAWRDRMVEAETRR